MSNSTKPTLFSDKTDKSVKILSAVKSTKTQPKASIFWKYLAIVAFATAIVSVVFNFLN